MTPPLISGGITLEIHGTTKRIRCHRQCGYIANWVKEAPRQCPVCLAPVRPDVVWFGEGLNPYLFELAEETTASADVFFSVGTSGIVQPTASLAMLAKNSGAMLIEVNPAQTPYSDISDYVVRASAGEFFQSLCKTVKSLRFRQLR